MKNNLRWKMQKLEFPGTTESYCGYSMHLFTVDGCECRIVEPKQPRPGRQWVWKAEFFTAFPKFELAMLERGFYLAFQSVGNTFGCPGAMKHFDVFYQEMTDKYGFSRHPILLGLSRGGLYIYNWGARNTDKLACLYADNPVCDFKSWPGGKGIGPGSPADWAKLIQDYGFADEAEAMAWTHNPIDNLEPFIRAGIPLIHAAGVDDEVVPFCENTEILEKRCLEQGGKIKVFRHPGKHHPHGLEDPTPLIEYILQNGIGLSS